MPPMTGRVVAGRYNLQHPIGRGAMGVVWRARDQLLDRDVAVKEVVISALIGADERRNAYQRTLREARTAARLSHRGVVAVYDVAEEDGRPWIIMELVPSRSLDQVLVTEKRLDPLRTGRIGQQLLSALAAAHLAGVLHRDVKPSNVLIATDRIGSGLDERAVLTDFGIAQFEGDPRLTQTGMVMGSPGFTAPERIRGGDATPASDLWSLGATLYAAVEGRGPYEQRGGAITTMSAIINEDAPAAVHAGPLAPVIAALLRREPSARPSASAAARMFARLLPQLAEIAELPREMTQVSAAEPEPEPEPEPARAAAPPAALAGDQAGEADADGGGAPKATAEAAVLPEAAPAAAAPAAAAAGQLAAVAVEAAAALDERAAAGDLVPAGEPVEAGEAKAAAVTLLDAAPGAGAAEAATDRGPAGYQPTEFSLPVASPAQGRPTFTASQPGERAVPTFSPARQDQSGAAQPEPEPEPPYGTSPADAARSRSYPGSTAPFAGAGGQYAGPSQPAADLARQYTPGKGGGRAQRRRGSGRWIAAVIGAVLLAAVIGAGAAYALGHHTGATGATGSKTIADPATTGFHSVDALNHPSAALPAGWAPDQVTASEAKSAAGFTIGLPPGWREVRHGFATNFYGPEGMFLEVDLTPHKYPGMLREARYIAGRSAPAFTGYRLLHLQTVPVRSTEGAIWQFERTLSDVTVTADDILFIEPTTAGSQSYAVYIRAPSSGWGSTYLPAFDRILRTFQTLPAT